MICPAERVALVVVERDDGIVAVKAVVREWHPDEGWGVVEAPQVPGGLSNPMNPTNILEKPNKFGMRPADRWPCASI